VRAAADRSSAHAAFLGGSVNCYTATASAADLAAADALNNIPSITLGDAAGLYAINFLDNHRHRPHMMRASTLPALLLAAAAALLLLGTIAPTATARPLPLRLGGYNSDAATLTLHFYTK
jgi:hypothetical protein